MNINTALFSIYINSMEVIMKLIFKFYQHQTKKINKDYCLLHIIAVIMPGLLP